MIGFGPGSGADISARIIGARVSTLIGQQLVIENKAGAGSSLAAELVARAPKDGYTLLLGSISAAGTGQTHPATHRPARQEQRHSSRSTKGSPLGTAGW
jgi:tripartite-type tricarboxylate transporter receptor subunit TctC